MTQTVAEAYARGRAAYPKLSLSESAFRRFLGRVLAGRTPSAIEKLNGAELFFACACAEQIDGAAKLFEERFVPIIRRAVARVLSEPAEREEAVQRTRQHLLVSDRERPPNIAKFRGEGPLASWVAVASIRLAVSMGRSATSERRLRTKAANEIAGADPEILLMKGQIRRELEAAVAAALQRLDDRERLLLRLYLVSGMTVAAIGRSLGLSQSTVSRHIAGARDRLLDDVRRTLGERLRLPREEMSSLVRLVASRLDVSLSRLLGAA